MPIKNMTDRATLKSRGAFTKLGKLYKGSPKKKVQRKDKHGKTYEIEIQGDDLNYFRFESPDAVLSATFDRLFGEGRGEDAGKPGDGYENAIAFVLPNPDMEKSFPSWMLRYRGGSCWIKCDKEFIHSERVVVQGRDGKDCTQWIDYATTKRPPCRFPLCDKGKNGMEPCGEDGTLRIVLPQLQRHGIVELGLHAKNDLPYVSGQIAEIEELAIAHGLLLHQMPLLLYRADRSISSPNFKDPTQRQRIEKSLVNVEVHPIFYQRSLGAREQFALASAGSVGGTQLQLSPMKSAQPDTSEWSDEFGKRPSLDFMKTPEWADYKMALDKARSPQQVIKAEQDAYQLIKAGNLSPTAKNQVAIAATAAQKRIDEQGIVPIEVEFEEEISSEVKERFESIALQTGHDMKQIEAMANELEFPVNITEWDAKQCRTLRNRLYIRCDRAVKAFGNIESSEAEYRHFLSAGLVDFDNDDEVWGAWSAIAY